MAEPAFRCSWFLFFSSSAQPWLLCPEDQAGLLEVGLASLQGGVGVQPESARFCRADSAVPSPPVPSGLGMSLAKPRHHRPEVAWASDNFGRNEAHKTRACLRLRPGMGAVPLYGLHFTSVRKFNKLSFVLHTGKRAARDDPEEALGSLACFFFLQRLVYWL